MAIDIDGRRSRRPTSIGTWVYLATSISIILGTIVLCGTMLMQKMVTTDSRTQTATRNAQTFATAIGWEVRGVVCSGTDSDGDTYVSCTVNTTEGVKAIQCGFDIPFQFLGQNKGCKLDTPIMMQGGSN